LKIPHSDPKSPAGILVFRAKLFPNPLHGFKLLPIYG
jgi:hypothetical protein